jgi:ethanolamine utilization microcompartment shell protein EutS
VTELRAFVEIDSMQPQWAACVAQSCQGDPPTAGMAQLYVEVAPANDVFALVDVAVKSADVRPGLQVVERQYGTLEVHGQSLSDVRHAGETILQRIGAALGQRAAPEIVATATVARVDASQAQLVNRMGVASLLVEGEAMFALEATPAAYVALAANEAEKHAPVKLVYAATLGATGRLIVAGDDAAASEARRAALDALRL